MPISAAENPHSSRSGASLGNQPRAGIGLALACGSGPGGAAVIVNTLVPGPTRSEGLATFIADLACEKGFVDEDGGGPVFRLHAAFLPDSALCRYPASGQPGGLSMPFPGLGDHRCGACASTAVWCAPFLDGGPDIVRGAGQGPPIVAGVCRSTRSATCLTACWRSSSSAAAR